MSESERVRDTHCELCRMQMGMMKRCTRCKDVLYCSRDCQVKDWPRHSQICGSNPVKSKAAVNQYQKNDNSIFGGNNQASTSNATIQHPPLVDFSKAIKKSSTNEEIKPQGKSYLSRNVYHTDVPEINESEPKSNIVIKCHKIKHKVCIQNTWSGGQVYKYLSYTLCVPLEKLKIIHKGKVLTTETISGTIQDRALYQVIGEKAESEDGIDQRDISIMMRQSGVDRNAAVQMLRKKGDLIDALLQ